MKRRFLAAAAAALFVTPAVAQTKWDLPAAYPAIIATSSEKGEGLDELRAAIALAVGGG